MLRVPDGRRRSRLGALAALACACATPASGPSSTEAYLQALQRGDVDRAWSLTSPRFQASTSLEAYRSRFAEPSVREAHVSASASGARRAGARSCWTHSPLTLRQPRRCGRWRARPRPVSSARRGSGWRPPSGCESPPRSWAATSRRCPTCRPGWRGRWRRWKLPGVERRGDALDVTERRSGSGGGGERAATGGGPGVRETGCRPRRRCWQR